MPPENESEPVAVGKDGQPLRGAAKAAVAAKAAGKKSGVKGHPKGVPYRREKCPRCGEEIPVNLKGQHPKTCKGLNPTSLDAINLKAAENAGKTFDLGDYPGSGSTGPPGEDTQAEGGAERAPGPSPSEGLPVALIGQVMDTGFWHIVTDFVNGFIRREKNKVQMDETKAKALHQAMLACFPQILANPLLLFGIMLTVTFAFPVAKDKWEDRQEAVARAAAAQRAKDASAPAQIEAAFAGKPAGATA